MTSNVWCTATMLQGDCLPKLHALFYQYYTQLTPHVASYYDQIGTLFDAYLNITCTPFDDYIKDQEQVSHCQNWRCGSRTPSPARLIESWCWLEYWLIKNPFVVCQVTVKTRLLWPWYVYHELRVVTGEGNNRVLMDLKMHLKVGNP